MLYLGCIEIAEDLHERCDFPRDRPQRLRPALEKHLSAKVGIRRAAGMNVRKPKRNHTLRRKRRLLARNIDAVRRSLAGLCPSPH